MGLVTKTTRRGGVPPSTADVKYDRFSGNRNISAIIELSCDEEDNVRILNFISRNTPSWNRIKQPQFNCKICTYTKTMMDAFYICGCFHTYCSDCVAKYIGSKLDDNIVNIRCPVPRCKGFLQAEFCRSILLAEVFERWCKGLCEALFNVSGNFNCPFADCSALLINEGKKAVRKSYCPHCNRRLCAQCKVPWHEGLECSEFEKLNADERGKEDVMLMSLAKDMLWKRCPRCRFYVAKNGGCNEMICRCFCKFCYKCGGTYSYYNQKCNCFCYKCGRIYSYNKRCNCYKENPIYSAFLQSFNKWSDWNIDDCILYGLLLFCFGSFIVVPAVDSFRGNDSRVCVDCA